MKELIITVSGIVLAVFLGSLILGADAGSMKSQTKAIHDSSVTSLKEAAEW